MGARSTCYEFFALRTYNYPVDRSKKTRVGEGAIDQHFSDGKREIAISVKGQCDEDWRTTLAQLRYISGYRGLLVFQEVNTRGERCLIAISDRTPKIFECPLLMRMMAVAM